MFNSEDYPRGEGNVGGDVNAPIRVFDPGRRVVPFAWKSTSAIVYKGTNVQVGTESAEAFVEKAGKLLISNPPSPFGLPIVHCNDFVHEIVKFSKQESIRL